MSYTHYPRTILWLVRGGSLDLGHAGADPAEVEIPSFYVGKFPITNEQFEAFQPDFERSAVSSGDASPATGVSFDQALAFCFWYAEVSRKPMRLPTEHEWEYACRAGDRGALPREIRVGTAWDASNSGGVCPPLDQRKSNEFGLYGMLGGVWEWTSAAEGEDRRRVLRGGSFRTPSAELSYQLRRPARPDLEADDVGFRIARSFP